MSKSFEEILRSLDHEIPQNNAKSKKKQPKGSTSWSRLQWRYAPQGRGHEHTELVYVQIWHSGIIVAREGDFIHC